VSAFVGALVGGLLGMASQIVHVLDPTSSEVDPFLRTLGELLLGSLIGASTFAAVTAIGNWLLSKRPD
jgi:hypothetical protein